MALAAATFSPKGQPGDSGGFPVELYVELSGRIVMGAALIDFGQLRAIERLQRRTCYRLQEW